MAGSSRLDRLFSLLHSGSSESARLAAARAIGDVQRDQPENLHALLQRALRFLYSDELNTQRAAAAALGAIASAATWQPSHPASTDAAAEEAARREAEGAWLSFGDFSMEQALRDGAPLLASGGGEFDAAPPAAGERPRERLLRQRRALQQRLGMGEMRHAVEGQMEELLDERDVADGAAAGSRRSVARQPEAAASLAQRLDGGRGGARSVAKRRAKQLAAAGGDGGAAVAQLRPEGAPPPAKRARAADEAGEEAAEEASSSAAVGWERASEWPFEALCAELRCGLFAEAWQQRHGAAAGLRAVLSVHAATAGASAAVARAVSDELRAQWLEDGAIRLLCVLALDRFGGSGAVLAPAAPAQIGQRLERLHRAAETLQQHGIDDRADIGRAQQPDAGESLVLRQGRGRRAGHPPAVSLLPPTRGSSPLASRAIFSRWR